MKSDNNHNKSKNNSRWKFMVISTNTDYIWTPTHGRVKAGRPARTYIQQLCEDTGCCPEDLPRAMNDREEWRERARDIRATSAIWWHSAIPDYWLTVYSLGQWSGRPGLSFRSNHTKDSKKLSWMLPWLTLSIIRYRSRVKWSNRGNGVVLFTNPYARAGYDTRSIFKRSLTGFNSEFSFS